MITDTQKQDDASPRLGRRVAHFNRLVTNRVAKRVAPWLPGFGVVAHLGRTSHRPYRTPVNVFRVDDGYVVSRVLADIEKASGRLVPSVRAGFGARVSAAVFGRASEDTERSEEQRQLSGSQSQ